MYSLSPERYRRRETTNSPGLRWNFGRFFLRTAIAAAEEGTVLTCTSRGILVSAGFSESPVSWAFGSSPFSGDVLKAGEPVSFMVSGSTNVSVTSASPSGNRALVPLKMTSSIRPPRRDLALCSPKTQAMASDMLLLPHPFGPTIVATPMPSKTSSVLSANDLKPWIRILCSLSKGITCELREIRFERLCKESQRSLTQKQKECKETWQNARQH